MMAARNLRTACRARDAAPARLSPPSPLGGEGWGEGGTRRVAIAALAILTALATPALPCALPEPFAVSDIALGPVVAAATVADYRLENSDGILTLNITEVWKGQAPARLTARWETKLAEPPPETWDRRAAVIAAIAPSDAGFDLVVEMCGSAWLVPDTSENRAEVRAALTP